MRAVCAIAAAALLLALGPVAAAGDASCGGDVPCRVEGGDYRIALPPGGAPAGVYLFFHGYEGSAADQMQATDLIATARAHGYAFAAADGLGRTWSFENSPTQDRDETRFVGQVLDDLQRRFGFGPDRVVVGGFSQGASMAWYVACHLGDRVAGAVTFSGVFWDPLPQPSDCETAPPPMIHFHGRADRTFPLAGRAIGDRWHQGDTFESRAVLAARGQCGPEDTQPMTIAGVACEVTPGCLRGAIALCLHDGGHEVRANWLDGALGALPGLGVPGGLRAGQ
ncbi:polyhydroxybutyrate depolymerase [Inquilinus ginsengisoli]|uniref:Polyhydroxybutyrate depolymerase n=1 Tax=Inquilinus ginsengisoli TaxID=363840 RepID=A0ABU1JJQ7_9PROT|nr:alpha/beta fold hydrolase [Inquilinus ginsengisoli]MDR6287809.1 polyhydroxybutyrate depolymerase [Inquilinus ginsengisoli]